MGKPANASGRGPSMARSDGLSSVSGFLGDFARGHVLFTLWDLGPDRTQFPNGPNHYLIDVDDGVGARECCRFTDDPEDPPIWNGAWNNDQWCPWILKRAKALIAR